LLVGGRRTIPPRAAVDDVTRADGAVVSTPAFKASFSGLLKTPLDLSPEGTG
jgi:FMN reductase